MITRSKSLLAVVVTRMLVSRVSTIKPFPYVKSDVCQGELFNTSSCTPWAFIMNRRALMLRTISKCRNDSIFLRKIKRFLERRPRSLSFDCLSVLINYVISGLGLNLGFELTVVIIALKSIKMLEHCVVAQVKSPVELNLIRCHCTNGNLRDVVESMISAL